MVELKRMLQKLGYFRVDGPAIPEAPEFDIEPELMQTDPERFKALLGAFREKSAAFSDAYGVYDVEAMDAVDAFRKDRKLDRSGQARGLVDAALVEELRKLYYSR